MMSTNNTGRCFLWYFISLTLTALTDASWGHSIRILPPKIAVAETTGDVSRIRVIDASPRKLFDKLTLKHESYDFPNLYLPGTEGNVTNNTFGDIDYLYRNRTYYVINVKSKQIEAFELLRGVYQRRVVYRGTSSNVRGIAVNWITGDVYWTDSSYNVILMTPGNGSCDTTSCPMAVISADVYNPSGIAVHVIKGLLFWLDAHRLQVANLDGRNRSTLISNLTAPASLCISYPDSRLYWIDQKGDTSVIESCDLQGQDWKFITSFPARRLFDLDVFQGVIIATDRLNSCIVLYDLESSTSVEHQYGGNLLGIIVVYGQEQQYIKGHNTRPFSTKTKLEEGVLLIASATGIFSIRKSFSELPNNDNLKALFSLGGVKSIATDVRSAFLYYFTKEPSARIERTTLTCSLQHTAACSERTEMVSVVVDNVEGLAVDWVVKNLYWTDGGTRQIMVSRDNGEFPLVVVDVIQEPRAIAVDPINRYLFWSDVYEDKLSGTAPKIERADLDGSMRKEVYSCKYGPLGLAVDFRTNRLYWSDGPDLCSGDSEGRERRPCEHLQNLKRNIRTIDMMADYIVWTDTVAGGLFAADTESQSGRKFDIVGSSLSRTTFFDVVYHHISRQPVKKNMCSTNNGGCGQVCLPNLYPEGRRCACALGYSLQVDGSCKAVPFDELFLLFADQRHSNIYQSSLLLNVISVIPFQTIRAPADVTFDPIENMIYWSDYWFQTINRGRLNGGQQEVVFANANVVPTSLAIDWYSRLLYFIDYNSGSIMVLSLKNWTTKSLIKQWDISVRDIALHPSRGLMFFTAQITTYINKTTNTSETTSESTTTGAVYAAYMDGTNANPIAWGLAKPKGITVYEDCVFWVDAGVNTIERVTIGDWNYTLLLQLPLTEENEPVDVAVARDHVYWTERGATTIRRMSLKQDGASTEDYGYPRFFKLLGLAVMEERSHIDLENSSCSGDNSGCYHMCLPTPDGAVCTCPVEYSFGPHCYTNTRKSTRRRKFMKMNFCIIPEVHNGTTVDVTPGSFVSPGFHVRVTCDVGFKLTSQWNWMHHQRGVSLAQSLEELVCTEGGRWDKDIFCQWDMHYSINGTWSHGYVILNESTPFLVHPGIHLLDVLCIGAGGGGFDPDLAAFKEKVKAGNGGTTSFGSYVQSSGGHGGTLKEGGAGGFGYTLYGGNGGNSKDCQGGGSAGQTWDSSECVLSSTSCLFCGAGAAPNCSTCHLKQQRRAIADDSAKLADDNSNTGHSATLDNSSKLADDNSNIEGHGATLDSSSKLADDNSNIEGHSPSFDESSKLAADDNSNTEGHGATFDDGSKLADDNYNIEGHTSSPSFDDSAKLAADDNSNTEGHGATLATLNNSSKLADVSVNSVKNRIVRSVPGSVDYKTKSFKSSSLSKSKGKQIKGYRKKKANYKKMKRPKDKILLKKSIQRKQLHKTFQDVSGLKTKTHDTRKERKSHVDVDQKKDNPKTIHPGLKGGCSGPWATKRAGEIAGKSGGGATGRNGGWGGGGGGFSRLHVDVKPGEIIQVEVGKGGVPSVGLAGSGIVIVAWGWSMDTFIGRDKQWEDEAHHCIGYS